MLFQLKERNFSHIIDWEFLKRVKFSCILLDNLSVFEGKIRGRHWFCYTLNTYFLNSIGYPVIPKYYYVPADFVEHEKRNPGSQKRFPSNCGRDGKLFLWGQALYVIAKLLGKWRRLGILFFFPYQDFRNKYVFVGIFFWIWVVYHAVKRPC